MNKVALVLGVVAVLGTSFFAGQKSFGTVEYDHADVIDAVSQCGEGQFIGGCKACGGCADDEYKAGGCSYFKNTFCTLCTDIKHCDHQYIRCSNRDDEVCTQCDEGFWGDDCQKCTVCNDTPGLYETDACNQDADAVCAACTVCDEGSFTSTVCTATSNSACSSCSSCLPGSYMDVQCQDKETKGLGAVDSVYELGADTVCDECKDCGPEHPDFQFEAIFTTDVCSTEFRGQTECSDCGGCPEGSYISQYCQPGSSEALGHDTECRDCTTRRDGEWTVFPCSPLHTSDAVHQGCSECKDGEYKSEDCTESSDTVCPACPSAAETLYEGDEHFKSGLQYCRKDERGAVMVRCDDDKESRCGRWECEGDECPPKCQHAHSGGGQCGPWTSNCMEGFSGESCCYNKYSYSCGSMTARERVGKRAGYTGDTSDDFVDFCRLLCDEFPDCMAFEVEDGGTAEAPEGPNVLNEDSVCSFKAAYTQDPMHNFYGSDPSKDCYSNTCRQNSYNLVGSRFAKTINYKVESTSQDAVTVGDGAGRR